jgi:carbamate kinase
MMGLKAGEGSLAVLALGGNAILKAGQEARDDVQIANLQAAFSKILPLFDHHPRMVITHGNGPQVGNILLRNELCHAEVPSMPLDVCVAESQGQIAYMALQAWDRACRLLGWEVPMMPVITRTVVSADDPAFRDPTKPIGPYYQKERANTLARDKGWVFQEDIRRGGMRRVVPSPDVVKVAKEEHLRTLAESLTPPFAVLCGGGGGVPVVQSGSGFSGVEAVVDKDLASARLAEVLHADILIMVTDVEAVYLDFTSDRPRPLQKVSVEELSRHAAEGQFPSGSMGPKVEAATRFVKATGRKAVITSADRLMDALEGKAGTTVE